MRTLYNTATHTYTLLIHCYSVPTRLESASGGNHSNNKYHGKLTITFPNSIEDQVEVSIQTEKGSTVLH